MKKEEIVKLISAEGFEFVIDKEAAMVSQTIRNMFTSPGGFSEAELGQVTFPEISTPILEKICQYFYWHLQLARNYFLCETSPYLCPMELQPFMIYQNMVEDICLVKSLV